jgi:hypothetical protein
MTAYVIINNLCINWAITPPELIRGRGNELPQ